MAILNISYKVVISLSIFNIYYKKRLKDGPGSTHINNFRV